MDPFELSVLTLVGIAFGVINTLAGGGSIMSLTALLLLGLPPHLANGTNRVGGLIQSLSATLAFLRARLIPRRALMCAAPAATLGALFGARLSLLFPELLLERLIAVALLTFSLALLAPQRWLERPPPPASGAPLQVLSAFFIGLYGGFLQAGIGILLLWMGRRFYGLSVEAATALKVTVATALTIPALLVFWYHGQIFWLAGGALATGGAVGALLAVRWTQSHGVRAIRYGLLATASLFSLKLFFQHQTLF